MYCRMTVTPEPVYNAVFKFCLCFILLLVSHNFASQRLRVRIAVSLHIEFACLAALRRTRRELFARLVLCGSPTLGLLSVCSSCKCSTISSAAACTISFNQCDIFNACVFSWEFFVWQQRFYTIVLDFNKVCGCLFVALLTWTKTARYSQAFAHTQCCYEAEILKS